MNFEKLLILYVLPAVAESLRQRSQQVRRGKHGSGMMVTWVMVYQKTGSFQPVLV
ncbi:hypothetical protein F442_20039 [Phytophthora nicotianae P10297]|uniref:Uncharacterized protein n=1 Tax=Phytophthora nicotianae P10297 TaxID=1317064 RepID=W2YA24_PHYNI|nr:hypothetical protein F442_20039 [Phytophthora nicotianae P10297]